MEAGEAESTDCVDRHILFITRAVSSPESSPSLPLMSPAPPPATANQDSYGGVAGQKVILRKHPQQLLAPVAGLRSTGRLWQRCGATQNLQRNTQASGVGKCSRAPIAFYLEAGPPAHLAGHRRCHPDELPRPSVPVFPLCPCELLGHPSIISSVIVLSAVWRLIRRIRTPEFAVLNE